MVICIYLFSMVATLNFNCDNILVASYIKFVIIEFDNFRYSFTYVMNLIPIKDFLRFFSYEFISHHGFHDKLNKRIKRNSFKYVG